MTYAHMESLLRTEGGGGGGGGRTLGAVHKVCHAEVGEGEGIIKKV